MISDKKIMRETILFREIEFLNKMKFKDIQWDIIQFIEEDKI